MPAIEDLAGVIHELSPGRRVCVAVDGPDAAGKTTLARTLAQMLQRPVITASIDDWHNPRHIRERRGELSPEGYYRDSFDLVALSDELLGPFAAGSPIVRTAHFDHRADSETRVEAAVPVDAVLVFDGVFLLRPELRTRWDLGVYLYVPEAVTLARAASRDAGPFTPAEVVEMRYAAKYLPGQALYRQEARPWETAHIVLDNTDPRNPVVLKWDPRSST
ncbi:MAG: uridine kinase [Frankiales bacterium]|nr:uridine kinase [Frankiales bacterium]